MKANRKFVEGREAVSAVIGVILMVAITVALVAVVYVYLSGMLTGTTQATPAISFNVDNTNDKLEIASVNPSAKWKDIKIVLSADTGTISSVWVNLSNGTNVFSWTNINQQSCAIDNITATYDIGAYDYIQVAATSGATVTVKLIYKPTNAAMGSQSISI